MLSDFADEIRACGYLSIDIETMTVPLFSKKGVPHEERLACRKFVLNTDYTRAITANFGLSVLAEVLSITVAWGDPEDEKSNKIYTSFLPHHEQDLETLRQLANEGILFIAHNAIFDIRSLGVHFGIYPKNVWCTMVMSRLLYYKLDDYRLLNVARFCRVYFPHFLYRVKDTRAEIGHVMNRYLQWDFYTTNQSIELWKADQAALRKKLEADLEGKLIVPYMAWDAILPIRIYQAQQAFVKFVERKSSVLSELIDYEKRAMRVYCNMAIKGIKLKEAWVLEEIERLNAVIEENEGWLKELGLINPNSPQQAVHFIFKTLRIPLPDKENIDNRIFFTAKEALSASTDAILILYAMHKDKQWEAEGLLRLGLVRLATQKKSVLENWLGTAALTGRLHSMIVTTTHTGRRTSSKPNLQNVKMSYDPTNPFEKVIKGMAGAFEGDYELWEKDINRAELNLAAALSEDNEMALACVSSDAHTEFAKIYFGEIFEQADAPTRKVLRTLGKNITFATQYGGGAKTVAANTNKFALQHGIERRLTVEEAQEILKRIEIKYAHIASAKRVAQRVAENSGRVVLWTGRQLGICLANDKPEDVNYRVAWNYLCQGGVAEITKRIMILTTEELEARQIPARIALEVHDSLIIDCALAVLPEVEAILEEKLALVVPDYLKNRTNPPIVWKLSEVGEENYAKWGYNNVTSNLSRIS